MNNLKCPCCDSDLYRIPGTTRFKCSSCYLANISFQKRDLISFYNLYIKLNNRCYHIFSSYDDITRLSYYTGYDNYQLIIEINKFKTITSELPLKEQVQKIVEELLGLAIFL